MNQNTVKFALVAAGLFALAAAFYFYRPTAIPATRVSVTGEASSELPPDNAVVSFSVYTQNREAVAAQNENSKRVEGVIKALEGASAGAAQKIETSGYNLTAQRDWSSASERINGYEARNTITVTTDKMDQVGAIIDAATKAGANEVAGVSFVLREDSGKRGEALGIATRQAMAKADAIAASLGGRVSRVVETVESGARQGPVPAGDGLADYRAASNSAAIAPVVPVRPSSVSVRGQVTVTVEVTMNR